MNDNTNTSVSIRNLSLNFGAVQVLKEMDLDVSEGEFLVLLGPSGCGKSTLLNCIAGLLDVSGGQIHISGRTSPGKNPRIGASAWCSSPTLFILK